MSDVVIKGGCRTIVAEADIGHDVTFTSRRGLLLAVTSEGKLVPGGGLSTDEATKAVADRLVEYFGHGYGGQLREALHRVSLAEAETRRVKAEVKLQRDRAVRAEGERDRAKDQLRQAEINAALKAKEARP